jgi:arylsulfatase A-like enzyme
VKRRNLFLGTLSGITSSAIASLSSKNLFASTKPNIIIILADDMRWDALGVMGNRIIRTPNLDRLAYEGVLFLNNFVTTSICPTSRASIFSGQYGRRHQIWDFETPFTSQQFQQTYPALLRASGYQTAFIGKWGLGGELPSLEFDYWRGFARQGHYFEQNRQQHLTQLLTEQAIEFIQTRSLQKPFCLSLSYKAPHAQDRDREPFQPEADLASLYQDVTIPKPPTVTEEHFDRLPNFLKKSSARNRWYNRFSDDKIFQHSVKQYYRLITGLDRGIGRIIEALSEQNLLENTCIVFTSDNGFFLGERGLSDKWFGYEESIRTPLIIKPAQRAIRQIIPSITLNIDLASTIVELAGLECPSSMQGLSLTPLWTGESQQLRELFFYEHLLKSSKIPKSEGVRTENYKYLRYLIGNPPYEMLFDLQIDPLEEKNLVQLEEYQNKLEELRKIFQEIQQAIAQSPSSHSPI